MRLIDADAMRQGWLENGQNEYVYDTNAVLDSIDDQPTIDPETLSCRLESKTSDKTSDSKWIPISELPTEDGYYWCVDKDGDFFDAFYSEEEKSFGVVCSIWNTETFEKDDEWCAYDVTHWMQLPQPPREE